MGWAGAIREGKLEEENRRLRSIVMDAGTTFLTFQVSACPLESWQISGGIDDKDKTSQEG